MTSRIDRISRLLNEYYKERKGGPAAKRRLTRREVELCKSYLKGAKA